MNLTHRPFESRAALYAAAAQMLAEALSLSAAVMLSGGETPFPAYEEAARMGGGAAEGARVFFSDERMVPYDDDRSNYGRTRALLQRMGLDADERVLRVPTELPLGDAAAAYGAMLEGLVPPRGSIALGLLGLGDDGHTASLFSVEDIERGRGGLAVAVPRTPGPDRVSVTPGLLAQVERIVFLTVGADKAAMVARFLDEPLQVVAGQAVEGCGHVELWSAELGE